MDTTSKILYFWETGKQKCLEDAIQSWVGKERHIVSKYFRDMGLVCHKSWYNRHLLSYEDFVPSRYNNQKKMFSKERYRQMDWCLHWHLIPLEQQTTYEKVSYNRNVSSEKTMGCFSRIMFITRKIWVLKLEIFRQKNNDVKGSELDMLLVYSMFMCCVLKTFTSLSPSSCTALHFKMDTPFVLRTHQSCSLSSFFASILVFIAPVQCVW